MGQADDGAGVEGSIDGAEAEDLSLGATGGGSVKAGTELAQAGIAIMPKVARRVVAAEEDSGVALVQSRARRSSRATADSSWAPRLPPSGGSCCAARRSEGNG